MSATVGLVGLVLVIAAAFTNGSVMQWLAGVFLIVLGVVFNHLRISVEKDD